MEEGQSGQVKSNQSSGRRDYALGMTKRRAGEGQWAQRNVITRVDGTAWAEQRSGNRHKRGALWVVRVVGLRTGLVGCSLLIVGGGKRGRDVAEVWYSCWLLGRCTQS